MNEIADLIQKYTANVAALAAHQAGITAAAESAVNLALALQKLTPPGVVTMDGGTITQWISTDGATVTKTKIPLVNLIPQPS